MNGDPLCTIVLLWVSAVGVWSWMVLCGEIRPPNWMRRKSWINHRRRK